MYRAKTALFHHIEDDPVFDCTIYDENNTYNDCIENEIEVRFKTEFCLLFIISGHISPFAWMRPYLVHGRH